MNRQLLIKPSCTVLDLLASIRNGKHMSFTVKYLTNKHSKAKHFENNFHSLLENVSPTVLIRQNSQIRARASSAKECCCSPKFEKFGKHRLAFPTATSGALKRNNS